LGASRKRPHSTKRYGAFNTVGADPFHKEMALLEAMKAGRL
jgi:hypothetical protein